jgi:hypothetical protein
VIPECAHAARTAIKLGMVIHDVDNNNIIDIEDIGPVALEYGMLRTDVDKDGALSLSEIQRVYREAVPAWKRGGIAIAGFFSPKYTIASVLADCDYDKDGQITWSDYVELRHRSCMETCGKAEDVLDILGDKYGPMPEHESKH